MKPFVSIGLAAALSAMPGPGIAQRPALRMTCHELLAGFPQADATINVLIGDTLYRDGDVGRVPISRAGRRLALGPVTDGGRRIYSYASHVRRGAIVRRTVFERVGTGPLRIRFVSTFDFARQRITDGKEPDSCHHDAFARRR